MAVNNSKHGGGNFTQNLSDFNLKVNKEGQLVNLNGSPIKKYAAFKDWLHKLKTGERAPRGRWFKGKSVGRAISVLDELHQQYIDNNGTYSAESLTSADPMERIRYIRQYALKHRLPIDPSTSSLD